MILRSRDHEFEDFLQISNLQIWNNAVPTLCHQGRETINDYILARRIAVTDVKVLASEESLSDHRYLVYNIDAGARKKKISIKKLNEDQLKEEVNRGTPSLIEYDSAEACHTNAQRITNHLASLVKKCMTRTRWWSEELQFEIRVSNCLNDHHVLVFLF